jgi:hypothetical protein
MYEWIDFWEYERCVNMNKNSVMVRTVVVVVLCGIYSAGIFAAQPIMYLCLNDSLAQKKSAKLVYGYVGDKRTPCMTEYSLLEYLAKKEQENQPRDTAAPVPPSLPTAAVTQQEDEAIAQLKKSIANGERPMLSETDLMNADLSNISLTGLDFKSADMRGARLVRADCSGASFENTYLKRADFSGADLSNAVLRGAYLQEADLRGAKGLLIENVKTAQTLAGAKMDMSLMDQVKKVCPEKLGFPKKCWENNAWSKTGDCNDIQKPEKVKE